MRRLRIANETLSLFVVAWAIGACSATDRCGNECCEADVQTSAPAGAPAVAPAATATAPAAPAALAVLAAPAAPVAAVGGPAAGDVAAGAAVHNYKRLSPRLARGASPEGDAAFAALRAAGIKSIVTVDGAMPDVAGAKRHGMRYVHIPFGYDGIPAATALELAKTFEQLEAAGPIFVHCHHGKHRGPAACEIARIVLDGVSNEEGLADMKLAGTDAKYAGLYASIRNFSKPSAETLAGVRADMPEVAPPTSRSAAMSAIDKSFDRMKLVRTARWGVPTENADIDPPHEAVILAEGLREFARRPEIAAESDAFRKLLADAEASAWEMSDALAKGKLDAGRAETAFAAAQVCCASCHTKFRDNTHR